MFADAAQQCEKYRLILYWKLEPFQGPISLWISEGVDSGRPTKLDYAAHGVTAFHLS
jgi:hypothetical protein